MAATRQQNWLGQQRVDVVHLRAIESAAAYDLDVFAGIALAGRRPLVVSGFEVVTTGAVGNDAEALVLRTAGGTAVSYHATESGSIFQVPDDRADEVLGPTNPRVSGAFTPGTTNYVGLDFVRTADPDTVDNVAFLNTTTDEDAFESVPLGRTVDYLVVVSTTEFSVTPGVVPIAVVVTDDSNKVETITDARNLLGRLGTGGSNPQEVAPYGFPGGRTEAQGSGDRGIGDVKAWMDAVMTRIWETGGGEWWYSQTADRNVRVISTGDAFASNGEYFEWASEHLHWTGQVVVFDNSTGYRNEVEDQATDNPGQTDLADGDCLFVDLDRTQDLTGADALVAQRAPLRTLGGSARPGSRWVLAWRLGDNIYTRDKQVAVGLAPEPPVAAWALDEVRYFFVDNEDGVDSNQGWLDAPPGTVFTTMQADAVKIKTIARLMTVLPPQGAGRKAVILFKSRVAGDCYLEEDASRSKVDLGHVSGYAPILKRGSTDLTNSELDRLLCGGHVYTAGPNGDGSWTATAGTSTGVTVAAGLPAEPGITGQRVRYKGNVTPELENTVAAVWVNSATVIAHGVTIDPPVAGDEFFVEAPGVVFEAFRDAAVQPTGYNLDAPLTDLGSVTAGIAVETTTVGDGSFRIGCLGKAAYSFCQLRSILGSVAAVTGADTISCARFYPDETGVLQGTGTGFIVKGALDVRCNRFLAGAAGAVDYVGDINDSESAFFTTGAAADDDVARIVAGQVQIGTGCQLFSGLEVYAGALGPSFIGSRGGSTGQVYIGVVAANRGAGLLVAGESVHLELSGIVFRNMLGNPAVKVAKGAQAAKMPGGTIIRCENLIDGSGGVNNGVAVDLSEAKNTTVELSDSTVGSGGTLGGGALLATMTGINPVVFRWADILMTDCLDLQGNHVVGPGGRGVGQCFVGRSAGGIAGDVEVGHILNATAATADTPPLPIMDFTIATSTTGTAQATGVAVTRENAEGYLYYTASGSPAVWVTSGFPDGVAYASIANPGRAQMTVPAVAGTNQKLRLGRPLNHFGVSSRFRMAWHPELVSVDADGNP